MDNLSKAFWATEGDNIRFSMPISKVDKEKRIVSGWATLDTLDKQGDIVSIDASAKAFQRFRGNIREQHTPMAVGKMVSFKQDKYFDKQTGQSHNGIYVDVYISKGAQDTWYKVTENILTGFSIGGRIKDSEDMYAKNADGPVRLIKEYELDELSLVDNPANPEANIVSIQKFADGVNEIEKNYLETVYWCSTNDTIILSEKNQYSCPHCDKTMVNIGFVESNDTSKADTIKELVESFTKASVSTGDFVSWGSSGGTARGKVTRVVRSGSVDVPGSDFTITAEADDPAVLIRVYRQNADGWAPTDTIVGHKMSTLRKIPALTKSSDEESDNEEAIDEVAKSIANNIEKEGINMARAPKISEVVEEVVEKSDTAVEEVIEDVVEEEIPVEKSADEATEEAVEKSADEAVDVVEEAIEKSESPTDESNVDLAKSVDEVKVSLVDAFKEFSATIKSLTDEIADLKKSVSAVSGEVDVVKGNINEVRGTLNEFGQRVDEVEADTAVRKSGDLGGIVQEVQMNKSMWGGRFLSSADLYR